MPSDETRLLCLMNGHRWQRRNAPMSINRHCERCGLKQLLVACLEGSGSRWIYNGYQEEDIKWQKEQLPVFKSHLAGQ